MARQAGQNLPARRTQSEWLSPWRESLDWSPTSLWQWFDDEVNRFFRGAPFSGTETGTGTWNPLTDVYETDEAWVIKTDLPGANPEDVEVLCTDDTLTLRGEIRQEEERREGGYFHSERYWGRFERSFPLPPGVNAEEVKASFRNGVLELRLPKAAGTREQQRRIPVQTSASTASPTDSESNR